MSNNTNRMSWAHINVNVSNLERSIAFYEKLGFSTLLPSIPYLALPLSDEPVPLPANTTDVLNLDPMTTGRACIMQLNEGFPKLDLTEFTGGEQRSPLTNRDLGVVRICLSSQNLESDVERLQSLGVDFVSTPKSMHKQLADVAICKDPDGTLIELIQTHLERWQDILN